MSLYHLQFPYCPVSGDFLETDALAPSLKEASNIAYLPDVTFRLPINLFTQVSQFPETLLPLTKHTQETIHHFPGLLHSYDTLTLFLISNMFVYLLTFPFVPPSSSPVISCIL